MISLVHSLSGERTRPTSMHPSTNKAQLMGPHVPFERQAVLTFCISEACSLKVRGTDPRSGTRQEIRHARRDRSDEIDEIDPRYDLIPSSFSENLRQNGSRSKAILQLVESLPVVSRRPKPCVVRRSTSPTIVSRMPMTIYGLTAVIGGVELLPQIAISMSGSHHLSTCTSAAMMRAVQSCTTFGYD